MPDRRTTRGASSSRRNSFFVNFVSSLVIKCFKILRTSFKVLDRTTEIESLVYLGQILKIYSTRDANLSRLLWDCRLKGCLQQMKTNWLWRIEPVTLWLQYSLCFYWTTVIWASGWWWLLGFIFACGRQNGAQWDSVHAQLGYTKFKLCILLLWCCDSPWWLFICVFMIQLAGELWLGCMKWKHWIRKKEVS